MKKLVAGMIMLMVMALAATAMAGGVGNYSKGVRMGQVTKFSVKGMIMKSGEGQMLMGSDSTPYVITDKEGNRKMINPWAFSSLDRGMQNQLNGVIGEYVVLSYDEAHMKFPNVDTAYTITGIEQIQPALDKICVARDFTKGSNSDGTRMGRFVKASTKGLMVDSYEIMFQQGNAGAQFKNMSISKDKALFDCAVAFLKAGQRVKINYNESIINLNVFGRNSNYDIVRIEPIKKASQALN